MEQLILILVDESLSMKPQKTEIVEGLNQLLDVQKEINPECRLIFIKFNSAVHIVHQGTEINSVMKLRMADYIPAGRTALFDGLQCGIDLAEQIKTPNERVVCIVMTDGDDTASKKNVSCKAIKKLLKKYQVKPNWSFTFIGKPYEHWKRTKPVSKIAYESNAHRHGFVIKQNSKIVSRKLRNCD